MIEFDAATRFAVAMKQWANLDRTGPSAFEALRFVFFEDLPGDIFDTGVPAGARYVEKPLQLAAGAVDLLGIPDDGIRRGIPGRGPSPPSRSL